MINFPYVPQVQLVVGGWKGGRRRDLMDVWRGRRVPSAQGLQSPWKCPWLGFLSKSSGTRGNWEPPRMSILLGAFRTHGEAFKRLFPPVGFHGVESSGRVPGGIHFSTLITSIIHVMRERVTIFVRV